MKIKIILFAASIIAFTHLKSQNIHINTDTIGNNTKSDNLYVKKISSDSLSSGFIIVIKKEVKLHKHSEHSEHVYVLDGEGDFQLGEQKMKIKKGDIIFIPKNTPHKVITTSKKPLKVISIQSPFFDGKDRILLEN